MTKRYEVSITDGKTDGQGDIILKDGFDIEAFNNCGGVMCK